MFPATIGKCCIGCRELITKFTSFQQLLQIRETRLFLCDHARRFSAFSPVPSVVSDPSSKVHVW